MEKAYIIACGKKIDDKGNLDPVNQVEDILLNNNIPQLNLYIDTLKTPWHSAVKKNRFRSGCAPVEAIVYAKNLINSKKVKAVIIYGRDFLKSEYTKSDRLNLMNIYNISIPEAYNELAQKYISLINIGKDRFKEISKLLFENYLKTYKSYDNKGKIPESKWYENITDLFRGVDCANPLIDFEGKVIISTKDIANLCKISNKNIIEIADAGVKSLEKDGALNIDNIAKFSHLQDVYNKTCQNAVIDFRNEFLESRAYLEVYTCYPVIPIAFILSTGIAKSIDQLIEIILTHELTVTGGMNLARAPWNNPTLNTLITMYSKLIKGNINIGGIHGNGGLGYKQGFVILKR